MTGSGGNMSEVGRKIEGMPRMSHNLYVSGKEEDIWYKSWVNLKCHWLTYLEKAYNIVVKNAGVHPDCLSYRHYDLGKVA